MEQNQFSKLSGLLKATREHFSATSSTKPTEDRPAYLVSASLSVGLFVVFYIFFEGLINLDNRPFTFLNHLPKGLSLLSFPLVFWLPINNAIGLSSSYSQKFYSFPMTQAFLLKEEE